MNSPANPYQPPSSEVFVAEPVTSMEPATKGRRFGTFLVDYACYMVFALFVGFAIGLVFGERGARFLHEVPNLLLGFVLYSTYYLFFEGLWARTPGKWLFGTIVVNTQNVRPSWKQVLGRTLCRFIPFEALTFFGERGLHDRFSGTLVMRTR